MSTATVLLFLKKLLPMDRIVAFVIGLIATAIIAIAGADGTEVKKKFCESELPKIPAVSAPAETVAK